MLPTVGQTLDGKFEITGTIGSGGMGVVYEAMQRGLQRLVALKLLTAEISTDASDVARFEREALTLSKLSHPNIVQFYSYGKAGTLPYIVMERLRGSSLQELLFANQPLDQALTLSVAIQVCDALAHAHSAGVFHRDIKPSNILLTENNTVKLIDFGLARLVSQVPMQKLTQTGMAVGSVLYMSPEQCTGLPVTERSDIYGLGAVLHHCWTGAPPFAADNAVALLFLHSNEPIESSERWEQLTETQQQIIAKCMAKDPAARYSSMSVLKRDLELLKDGKPPELEGKPAKAHGPIRNNANQTAAKHSRVPILLTGMALALATIAGAIFLVAKEPSAKETKPAVSANVREELMMLLRKNRFEDLDGAIALANRLEELTAAYEQDPHYDINTVIRAHTMLVGYYQRRHDQAGIRRHGRACIEIAKRGQLPAEAAVDYAGMLVAYHNACAIAKCNMSAMPIIEAALHDYPDLPVNQRAELQLVLSYDFAELEDTATVRKLIAEAKPFMTQNEEHFLQVDAILRNCEGIDSRRQAITPRQIRRAAKAANPLPKS
jgi:serine/threonine protein kinase